MFSSALLGYQQCCASWSFLPWAYAYILVGATREPHQTLTTGHIHIPWHMTFLFRRPLPSPSPPVDLQHFRERLQWAILHGYRCQSGNPIKLVPSTSLLWYRLPQPPVLVQGLGYQTALELARCGCTLFMVCRNAERGEEAVAKVKSETGKNACVWGCMCSPCACMCGSACEYTHAYMLFGPTYCVIGVCLLCDLLTGSTMICHSI